MDVIINSPSGTSLTGLPIASMRELSVDDILKLISDYYTDKRSNNCEKR
jgi:hypothetical protein